ncbi:PLP-dependent transferase [Cryphonectria parasitica EP155]|uniref:PLP-dependent transferase n=1 Tax=Cryphonectria parasitica (strain ATCC 38755 / EP155) TaxID=660469 RepID=A0A9P4XZL9_CRYP1|nr:PLP-dependent transferase [Cryphonectria parasitica EP155]KAF3763814.1 PLP-dependent transferase [Cryphonectria parasitica EP155]
METSTAKSLESSPLNRANEASELIDAVKALIIPFIQRADDHVNVRAAGDLLPPSVLNAHLSTLLPTTGQGAGREGLLKAIAEVLHNSVNTWDQGFLDKLYSSTTPVGLVTELLLATLNTNVHVYSVSPALSVIEKHTARSLARLFGFDGPRAGGVTVAGGSASNLTSLIIARSHLYPETKTQGNAGHKFVLFTSEHGHYSVEKAALIAGIGKANIRLVPVDAAGCMDPSALSALIATARAEGLTPLYVNATAGTTVLGSYDPLAEISAVCRRERVWMHVDASWGGPVVFSARHGPSRMRGAELADSVTVNPHKMLNAPVTCSFLLGPDMRVFHAANRTDAPYLFHGEDSNGDDEDSEATTWDLADLTLQCGRRGDALKLALAWVYHGPAGFEAQVDGAFEVAAFFAAEIGRRPAFTLVGESPPSCLQVCFYHRYSDRDNGATNTKRTVEMVKRLCGRGFMVDYASFPGSFKGKWGRAWQGSFFRVVVNIQTRRETIQGLVKALEEVGEEVESS